MTWTDDYYYMMLRVLTSLKCHPVAEWMGLGYICFAEDMEAYDPEKGTSPINYYAFRLRERVQRERNYKNRLIHVPLLHQGDVNMEIIAMDAPIGESGLSLADALADESSTDAHLLTPSIEDMVTKAKEHRYGELWIRHHIAGEAMTSLGDDIGVSKQVISARVARVNEYLREIFVDFA